MIKDGNGDIKIIKEIKGAFRISQDIDCIVVSPKNIKKFIRMLDKDSADLLAECMQILRDLAEIQNGAPLIQGEDEWNKK